VFMHEFHLRNLSIEFLRQPFLIQNLHVDRAFVPIALFEP
jgi:hypothetical protein